MGKSTPTAPNPYTTAAAQAQANSAAVRDSAAYNAVNQYGPLGATTYQRRSDGTPYAQTVTLAPSAQSVLDGQLRAADTLTARAASMARNITSVPLDVSKLPARPTAIPITGTVTETIPSQGNALQTVASTGLPPVPGLSDFGAEAARTQNASFGKAQALLQPDMTQSRNRLVQSLSDRGIPLDSSAGQAELNRLDRAQSEAMNRAAYDSIAAGSQEQSRLFGLASAARGQLYNEGLSTAGFNNDVANSRFSQDLASAQFANTAQNQRFSQAAQQASFSADQRDRALSEALTLRNQPLAETAAMLRAAPSFQMPGFQQTPAYSVEAPDISGLVEANYRNQVNAANQQQQALYGSAVNLASTALGAPWFGRWLGI
ncbi:hypothetical protein LA66_10305 [Aureimonas altamirensis]|uniref:Uncharacterized protein n=1 Tax=Aureimonas altamirensis TaxID=370622 RepID=A0A0B1Q299_9HYPH|nr:hypothetical protein [Aureimonas altamirensis]KHJ54928.1 hypothetical protein LA66_10305 [Aureimonas altamirensis]